MNLKPTKLRLMHILFLPLIVLLLLLSGCTLPAGSAVARLLGQSNPPAGYVAIYTNEAFFISWTAINSNLTGQLQTGRLDGNTVTNSTHAFKGVFNSPSISINFTGSVLTDSLSGQTWTGTMKNGVLTLVYPADNGTLQTIVFKSGSINDYNQAINSLQAQGNSQATQQVQPTASNAQSQSTTYAEPTFKDIMTASTSNEPEFKTDDDGSVMVTGKDGSFMLPVVAIAGTYVTTEGSGLSFPTSPISPINFDIPAAQADALAVYYLNRTITFLGPRGWKVSSVGISADGEMGVELISGDGSNEWMEIWFRGGMGLAAYQLGQWVPGMQAWASQQEPGFTYKPFLYPITFVSLGSHSQGFSYMGDPPYTTNGVNNYNITGQNKFFSQEFITLPDSSRSLETTILNFFLDYNVGQ
jgi:hypothetical protein